MAAKIIPRFDARCFYRLTDIFTGFVVCTIVLYLCTVKIEEEIRTRGFRNEYHKLHVNVIFSAWWLKSRLSASLKTFGLTTEQFNVLRIVRGQKEELCVKDITSRMLERNSNTTRIIDKLEAKGLVKRQTSSNDRREIRIHLTEKGSELLSEIDANWDRQDPVSLPLSEPEAKTLNNLLDRMRG
jgi:DNA-binding MarR family transcriptional regulator